MTNYIKGRRNLRGFGSSRPLRANPEQTYSFMDRGGGNDGVSAVAGTDQYLTYHRSWSGVRTPGFGSLSKSQLPINPHGVYIKSVHNGGMFEFTRSYTYGPDEIHEFHHYGLFDPSLVSSLGNTDASHELSKRNTAVARLATNAGSDMNNVAQDILQVSQLTRTVANTAARLVNSVSNLKKGNLLGAANALWRGKTPQYRKKGGPKQGASLANNWLEMQYGWKPLLQDAKGAAESLARYNLANSAIKVVRSSSSISRTQEERLVIEGLSAGYATAKTKTDVRFGLRYRIGSPMTAFLAQTGFTNPLNLAWEVLPFSFVVDWFVPIGQYLESLSSWHGLDFIDGFETRFTKRTSVVSLSWERTLYQGGSISSYDTKNGFHSTDQVLFDRLVLSSFPSQSLPSFRNPFTVTRGLSALALLRNVFR